MDRIALKKSVLEAARARLEENTTDLRERIQELRAVTIGDDNAESASQTESTHGSDVELLNSLVEQLEHLEQDIDRLEMITPDQQLKTVQYGAIVLTDKRNFLIASSVEEFKVRGEDYLGVTPKAPLVQAMMGRKAGEKISFNGIDYSIKEVF